MQKNLITAILNNEKVVTNLNELTGTAQYNDQQERPKVVPFKQSTHSFERQANYRLSLEGLEQKRSNKVRRWIGLISLAAVIITLIPLSQSIKRTQEARSELVSAEQAYREIEAFHQTVEGEYKRAQNPKYLEKIARRDYYYTHEGEIVFDLGPEGRAIDSQIYQDIEVNQVLDN